MHHAGTVGRRDVLCAELMLIKHLIMTHFGRNALLEHRERTAEPAAFVGAGKMDKLDALHLAQKIRQFREWLCAQLRHARNTETAKRLAIAVQHDLVRKLRPRKRVRFENVVQKLYELKGPCPDPPDLVGLLDRVQVEANLVCATPRRRHDIVVRGEVPDEKCLRRRGLWEPVLVIGWPQQVWS